MARGADHVFDSSAASTRRLRLFNYSDSEEGSAFGVEIPENEYGFEVIEDNDLYLQTVAEDSSKELVDLQEEVSGIRLDIRYANERKDDVDG